MARIRSVHPDICTSEKMAELADACQRHDGQCGCLERTFARLWTHCDDHGRCVENPKLLKAALYPLVDSLTAAHVEQDLDSLASAGLIVRYDCDGKHLLYVKSWHEFQKPNKPSQSKLPAPPNTDSPAPLPSGSGIPTSPEWSGVEVGEGVESLAAVDTATGKREIEAALNQYLGRASTSSAQANRGRVVKELSDVGATQPQIKARIDAYRGRWPTATCTDSALVKHWDSLVPVRSVPDQVVKRELPPEIQATLDAEEAKALA